MAFAKDMAFAKFVKFALVGALASALLAGCSASDVELKGSMFNAMGIGGRLSGSKNKTKAAVRAPLVVPPSAELPPPGAEKVALKPADWPDDPDVRRKKAAAKSKAARKKYCAEGAPEKDIDEFEKTFKHDAPTRCSAISDAFSRMLGKTKPADSE